MCQRFMKAELRSFARFLPVGVKIVVASILSRSYVTKVLLGEPFLLWVESNDFDRLPISYLSGPASRVLLSSQLVNFFTFGQFRNLFTIMSIIRSYETDLAMEMLAVVPLNEPIDPALCILLADKGQRRILWSILQGSSTLR